MLGLVALARSLHLGIDVLPYTLRLFTTGYAAAPTAVLMLGWAAVAGQFGALVAGRYAPYPEARERPPRGPLRELTRRIALAARARRRGSEATEDVASARI